MSKVVIGCCVAVPRSHWSAVPTLLFIYISQLLGDSFSVSQQPPICEFPSHSSLVTEVVIILGLDPGPVNPPLLGPGQTMDLKFSSQSDKRFHLSIVDDWWQDTWTHHTPAGAARCPQLSWTCWASEESLLSEERRHEGGEVEEIKRMQITWTRMVDSKRDFWRDLLTIRRYYVWT